MRILIKNATVVLPDGVDRRSVVVDGAQIAEIDPAPQLRVDEVIDAAGLHLIPGVVDDQVHFREPGLTHKEDLATASRACAKGGVTTFLEMPNTLPAATTRARVAEKLELAAEKSLVNYGFYIGATCDNLAELKAADRTPGIKIFIGSSTGDLLVDDQAALERIFAETTLPIAAHCEDETTVRANATRLAAMAKRYATDVGFEVVNGALQIHGGYGYLRDHPIERVLRDVRVHQILEGTNEIMRVIVSRDLLGN